MKKSTMFAALLAGTASFSSLAGNVIFTCEGLVKDVVANSSQYYVAFTNAYGVHQDGAYISKSKSYLLGSALQAERDGKKGIVYSLVVRSNDGDTRCRDNDDGSLELLAIVKS